MFRNAMCFMLLPAVCLALVCCSDPYKSESYDSDQKNTGDADPKDSETETETGDQAQENHQHNGDASGEDLRKLRPEAVSNELIA